MKFERKMFIDKIFGEEVEYILTYNEKEKVLIFQYKNKIKIINITSIDDLIQNFIEEKLLTEFLEETSEQQDSYIEYLEEKLNNSNIKYSFGEVAKWE